MYILPQPHRCNKCGHEEEWGPHEGRVAPTLGGDPVCPKCFEAFIKAHCGTLEPIRK